MVFKVTVWALLTPMLLWGFRVSPNGNLWRIDRGSNSSSKLFVIYPNPTLALRNDLPSGDPLAGTATVTIAQLMTSIFNDYNNVQGAFVTLVDTSDVDYATLSQGRTIRIEDGGTAGLTSGGEAQQTWDGNNISGCRISIKPLVFDAAKVFIDAVTHEIGHCLGLSHPLENTNSIMSYYKDPDTIRLQPDDMMGIIHLYPVNPQKAKEDSTLGMSCARR